MFNGVERCNPAEGGYATSKRYAVSWIVCKAVEKYALSFTMSTRSISARGYYGSGERLTHNPLTTDVDTVLIMPPCCHE